MKSNNYGKGKKMDNGIVSISAKKGRASLMDSFGGSVVFHPESSAVECVTYSLDTNTLGIAYTGNKQYFYREVPFATVIQMLNADSVGAFIAKRIKPNFEFWKAELY